MLFNVPIKVLKGQLTSNSLTTHASKSCFESGIRSAFRSSCQTELPPTTVELKSESANFSYIYLQLPNQKKTYEVTPISILLKCRFISG